MENSVTLVKNIDDEIIINLYDEINTELVLDISSKYHAENITINIDEIVKVNKIK